MRTRADRVRRNPIPSAAAENYFRPLTAHAISTFILRPDRRGSIQRSHADASREGRRLKDNRGRYVPPGRGDPNGAEVGWKAPATFLERAAEGSAADWE